MDKLGTPESASAFLPFALGRLGLIFANTILNSLSVTTVIQRLLHSRFSFEVATPDPEGHDSDFLSLGSDQSILVNSENRGLLASLCEELGNSELASLLIRSCELTISSTIEQFESKRRLKLENTAECAFIAKHFGEIVTSHSNFEEIGLLE
jgi:hypothetical protein